MRFNFKSLHQRNSLKISFSAKLKYKFLDQLNNSLMVMIFISCVSISSSVSAQVSGQGCDIGGNVATQYLGDAPYYGSSRIVQVYSSATKIPINSGNGTGYDCMAINDYNEFEVYDSSIKPYGGMRKVPASHEITRNPSSQQGECVIAPARFSTPVGEGKIVSYTYKNPAFCSNGLAPNNAPLDDYIPIFICAIGALGFFILKKQQVWTPLV